MQTEKSQQRNKKYSFVRYKRYFLFVSAVIFISGVITILNILNSEPKSPLYFSRNLILEQEIRYPNYKKINDTIFFCTGLIGLDFGAYGGENIALYLVDSSDQREKTIYYPIGIMEPSCDYKYELFDSKVVVTIYYIVDASDEFARNLYQLHDSIPKMPDYEILIDTIVVDISKNVSLKNNGN